MDIRVRLHLLRSDLLAPDLHFHLLPPVVRGRPFSTIARVKLVCTIG